MTLSTFDCIAAITVHSAGVADAARGNLEAPVEHCPGWSVADLVWHLTEVHWFWGTVVEELLTEPPDESRSPGRGPDDRLVDDFVAGAQRLVRVLREADQSATCWTWAPQRHDVAFVTRHQVQEAAVHHWDAGHAAGTTVDIRPEVAADAVEEFLTFSVSSDADPADPPRPALDGAVWFRPRDGDGSAWLVTDGAAPGTVSWRRVPRDVSPLDMADVADGTHTGGGDVEPQRLLLWLYGRCPDPWEDGATGSADEALLARLRDLCFTD